MIKTIPTATLRKRIEEIEQLLFKGEYICGLGKLSLNIMKAEMERRKELNERS